MEKNNFSALAVQNTIHLMNGDQHLNIQKDSNPELFERVFKLIEEGNVKELKSRFADIKTELEKYTKGNFLKGKDGQMYMKGDDEAIPLMLAKKLVKFHDEGLDFMPLVRFWKKLKLNPNQDVKKYLYEFLEHNNIPVTELGDVICEKGVSQLEDGKLVDVHTKTIDNSIGMIVTMERNKVNADRNQTCSVGLHVGAPDYVRNHWTSDIIVDVEVSPEDFVAIPSDYNNTKARVCRYKVLGVSKDTDKGLLYKVEFNIQSKETEIEKAEMVPTSALKQGRYYFGVNTNKEELIFIYNGKDHINMLNLTTKVFSTKDLTSISWESVVPLNSKKPTLASQNINMCYRRMKDWMDFCIIHEKFIPFIKTNSSLEEFEGFELWTAREIIEYVNLKTDLWQGADVKKMGKDKKALIRKAIYALYTYTK